MDNTDIDEIINQLEQINPTQKEKNSCKTICRLLRLHISDFFDNIYIPFKFFERDEWDISKVLNENEDCLFYNEDYLTDDDQTRFYQVFYKYIRMIEDIMCENNELIKHLKKWTDMSKTRWSERKSKSYLKSLLDKKNYQMISPLHIVNIFIECSEKNREDTTKIISEVEEKLNSIVKQMKTVIREFRGCYRGIIDSYVYEFPLNPDEKEAYIKGFINSIIMTIVDYTDALVNLGIYAVHPIFRDIIEHYLPLDEINTYDPEEHLGKKLSIV